MKSFIMACIVFSACACSRLDGDDVGDIADRIRELPSTDQAVISGNKRNDRLLDVIKSKNANGPIGFVTCEEPIPEEFREWALPFDPVISAWHLVDWLTKNPGAGLAGLEAHLKSTMTPGMVKAKLPGNPPCTPKLVMYPGWKIEELEAEADDMAEADDEAEDSAFWLPTLDASELTSRSALMTVLGLAFVGGVVVISVTNPVFMVLCPKVKGMDCPNNPVSPSSAPVFTPSDGGDR